MRLFSVDHDLFDFMVGQRFGDRDSEQILSQLDLVFLSPMSEADL